MALTTALVVGTLATSAYSARQAGKGAKAQVNASNRAIDAQQSSEARALELQRPFYEGGTRALAAAMDMAGVDRGPAKTIFDNAAYLEANPDVAASGLDAEYHYNRYGAAEGRQAPTTTDPNSLGAFDKFDWKTDPGYQFRMDEGQRALERSRAAGGLLNSGGTGRALVRYGQDYASNEYSKVYERIAKIAGFGGSAAAQGSQTIVNTGQNVGNALINAGEARASGYVAQGNAWANGVGQIGMMGGGGMLGKVA